MWKEGLWPGIWHLGWYLDAWKPLSILEKKAKSVLEPNSAWSQNLSCFFRLLKPRPLDQQFSLATISLVVQRLHKAIQWINCYPADEFNKTHYTIHWIQIFPVDSISSLWTIGLRCLPWVPQVSLFDLCSEKITETSIKGTPSIKKHKHLWFLK